VDIDPAGQLTGKSRAQMSRLRGLDQAHTLLLLRTLRDVIEPIHPANSLQLSRRAPNRHRTTAAYSSTSFGRPAGHLWRCKSMTHPRGRSLRVFQLELRDA
jgi:hypothetical protein